jgi:hypothetical protein
MQVIRSPDHPIARSPDGKETAGVDLMGADRTTKEGEAVGLALRVSTRHAAGLKTRGSITS